MLRIWN